MACRIIFSYHRGCGSVGRKCAFRRVTQGSIPVMGFGRNLSPVREIRYLSCEVSAEALPHLVDPITKEARIYEMRSAESRSLTYNDKSDKREDKARVKEW